MENENILIDDYYPETDSQSFELVTEKESLRPGVIMKVRGPIGITETENRNGRVYTNEFWDKVLGRDDIQEAIKERALVGAADHPTDKFVPPLSTVSHVMTKAWVEKDKKALMAESEVLDTPMGRIVSTLFKANVKLGASTRGGGNTIAKEGKNFVSEKGYKWGGFDFVFEPSAQNAYPKPVREQIEKIICESSPDSFQEDPAYFKGILEKLGCNSNLILERVKQPKATLNEDSDKKITTSDKDKLVVEELKKEVEVLRKNVKSLRESLISKDSMLRESVFQVKELKEKISVLVESVDVSVGASKEPESSQKEMQGLENLYDTVKLENDILLANYQEAINLAKAKKSQVVIESHVDKVSEDKFQDLYAKLLQYGRKVSSLTESGDLLSKKIEELKKSNEALRVERRKLISEKASLYSRLNLVIQETEESADEEELLLDEEENKIQEVVPQVESKPLVQKAVRPRLFENSLDSVVGGLRVMSEGLESAKRTSQADAVCDLIRKI